MKTTELIARLVESAILLEREVDNETGAAWRNGQVTTPGGVPVDMGGGWIVTEESANQINEEAGIAVGLRQGIRYPNETVAGEFTPYGYGEDESGWQKEIMPLFLGGGWKDHEDADDIARAVHAAVQEKFERLANKVHRAYGTRGEAEEAAGDS